jgi:hypothetical protein
MLLMLMLLLPWGLLDVRLLDGEKRVFRTGDGEDWLACGGEASAFSN